MAYFPLFANLRHKKVLIVGGGSAAFQQISQFLVFDADIILLADELDSNMPILINAYSSKITHIAKKPSLKAVQSLEVIPLLVVLTTNDVELNAEIYAYYSSENVLVEDPTSRARCDFIFPAIIKRGDVVCGISSGGKSPHVSQFIKMLFESSLPQNIDEINSHMDEVRKAVRQSIKDPSKRSKTLQMIFTRLIEDDNQTSDVEIDNIIAEAELS